MTDPRHARQTEHGRYYVVPGIETPLISVTNALSVIAKFGLPGWYASNAAAYAMDHLPSLVLRSRTDRDGALADIKGAAERARDSAAELGSRVHALAEAHVLGATLPEEEGDREAGLYVEQYLQFLDDFEVDLARDVVASEMTVVNRNDAYAGTLDVLLRLKLKHFLPGQIVDMADTPEERGVWLIDLKTSRTRNKNQTYLENHLQLAALRRATEWVTPDDRLERLYVRPSGCAVLNLRTTGYALIPSPADTAMFEAFRACLKIADLHHNGWPGEYGYRPVTSQGYFIPKRSRAGKRGARSPEIDTTTSDEE